MAMAMAMAMPIGWDIKRATLIMLDDCSVDNNYSEKFEEKRGR